jgi:hypothetical protein
LSRIKEDGRNWLRRPKICIKTCRAIIIIIRRRRPPIDSTNLQEFGNVCGRNITPKIAARG